MDYEQFIEPYRITDGAKFRLKDHDPGDTAHHEFSKKEAEELLSESVVRLAKQQEILYASDRWAMLAVFQAMDAAGKDGAIKHVMSGVNPQGCQVFAFKAPSAEELDHDFLWRTAWRVPERGRIGIFNRSYYEEVLVVRVHKELLERQKLPPALVSGNIWQQRFEAINAFERHLVRNGTAICKFFLNVSKKEQKKRFLERIEDPAKNWKFSESDVTERARWDEYMQAYEDLIRNTSTEDAPWYVVPADAKWFSRLVVAAAMIHTMEKLKLSYPTLDEASLKELKRVKEALEKEKE